MLTWYHTSDARLSIDSLNKKIGWSSLPATTSHKTPPDHSCSIDYYHENQSNFGYVGVDRVARHNLPQFNYPLFVFVRHIFSHFLPSSFVQSFVCVCVWLNSQSCLAQLNVDQIQSFDRTSNHERVYCCGSTIERSFVRRQIIRTCNRSTFPIWLPFWGKPGRTFGCSTGNFENFSNRLSGIRHL